MLSILGFIFMFIIIIILAGLFIVGGILRAIFGFGKRSSSRQSQRPGRQNNSTERNSDDALKNATKRKKIFDKEEGEYVDFEEVDSTDK